MTRRPAGVAGAALNTSRDCAWCLTRPASTVIITALATVTDAGEFVPARTAPACAECGGRLEAEQRRRELERRQAEHGSRLPVVSRQATLDQELYADHHRDEHGRRPAPLTPANAVTVTEDPDGPLFPHVHDTRGVFSC